jgi:hypothetical protein
MEISEQLIALAVLSPGKDPRCPLDRMLDWPQNRSGGGGEERKIPPLPGMEPRSFSP